VEHGATRNFQALKLAEEQAEREQKELEEEETSNPMKLLEKRTKQSKQEMDMMETLEEMRELNQRHANLDHTQMLDQHKELNERTQQRILQLQEEEDERIIRTVFGRDDNNKVIKRIVDEDSDDEQSSVTSSIAHTTSATDLLTDATATSSYKKAKLGESSVTSSTLSRSKISSLIKVKPRNELSGKVGQERLVSAEKGRTGVFQNGTVGTVVVKPNAQAQMSVEMQPKNPAEDKVSCSNNVVEASLPDQTSCPLPIGKISVNNSNPVGQLVKTAGFNLLGAYSDSDSQSD
jgi:hypothetical protein